MTVLYRVEKAGSEELGPPIPYRQMIERVKVLAPREKEGSLRIVRCEYNLDLNNPPQPMTPHQERVWKEVILHFPEIGTAGSFVKKPNSQHYVRTPDGFAANATDWTAPEEKTDAALIDALWDVFNWLRRQGIMYEDTNGQGGLPVAELIFRDTIATRAFGWTKRHYTGTFHATHVHDSAYPLFPVGESG